MRYTRMREYLSRSARDMRDRERDMRNPYNRSGYVGDRMGYDRTYYSNMDRNYPMSDYAENGRGGQYNRQYNRDNNYYEDMNYYPVRRSGYFNYNTYGGDRDYAENEYKLTPKELKKWEKELENVDGTKGGKFTVDQVKQFAQQQGIKFDEYSPELFTTIVNMMYSDYAKAVNGDMNTYIRMAKAFLHDDDFDGTPEEKAYLYYTTIVDKEDD